MILVEDTWKDFRPLSWITNRRRKQLTRVFVPSLPICRRSHHLIVPPRWISTAVSLSIYICMLIIPNPLWRVYQGATDHFCLKSCSEWKYKIFTSYYCNVTFYFQYNNILLRLLSTISSGSHSNDLYTTYIHTL